MAWIGGITAVVSVGMGAASAAGAFTPSQPNLGASSQQMSDTMAALLGPERALSAAAQAGGSALKVGYTKSNQGDVMRQQLQSQIDSLNKQLSTLPADVPAPPSRTGIGQTIQPLSPRVQIGKQISDLQNRIGAIQPGGDVYLDPNGNPVPQSQALTDFKGYGTADVQAKIADETAKNNLALQQKYDSKFIDSALAQEKEADPQSFAARAEMSKLIQQGIDQPTTNPTSQMLADQVQSRLKAGKGLDEFDTGVLNDATARALKDRGGSTVPADFAQPLTTGLAGNQRQLQGVGLATGELSSGTTPEDVAYRKEQQNLGNLSAEINGATPTTQFKSLSNAQVAPTPSMAGSPLPQTQNSLPLAAGAAATQYGQQAAQPNSWMAGISTVLNAAGAFGQMAK